MGVVNVDLRRVEMEIIEEKAVALARIAGRLRELTDQAEALRAAAAPAYETIRQQVRLYRWYLEVQREACGLSRHDDLDRLYPLPPPL